MFSRELYSPAVAASLTDRCPGLLDQSEAGLAVCFVWKKICVTFVLAAKMAAEIAEATAGRIRQVLYCGQCLDTSRNFGYAIPRFVRCRHHIKNISICKPELSRHLGFDVRTCAVSGGILGVQLMSFRYK